jgi:putative NADH-flavin reductase
MKTICVLGGWGRVGRLLVHRLLDYPDVCVIVLVRTASSRDLLLQFVNHSSRVRVVVGDICDPVVLSRCVVESEVICFCVANRLFAPVNQLYSKSAQSLADILSGSHKKLVWLTGYTGHRPNDLPWYQRIAFALPPFRQIYSDKAIAEEILGSIGVDWVAVKSLVMQDGGPSKYSVMSNYRVPGWPIRTSYRLDVADCIAQVALGLLDIRTEGVVISSRANNR